MKTFYAGALALCLAPSFAFAHGYGYGGGYGGRDHSYEPGGFLDLSFVADEKEKYTQDDPSGHFVDEGSGNGFGLRGLVRAYGGFALEGEYRSVSHDFSGGVSGDADDTRIGAGYATPSNSGVFVEWNKLKFTDTLGTNFSMDGWALRGRLEGDVAPQVRIYGEAAYVDMKDDFDLDWKGPEVSAGASFALSDLFSLFADYRIRELKATDDPSATTAKDRFNSVNVGVRMNFGG